MHADPSSVALGEYIRAQRHLARLSLREMARAAGVSDSYLSQVERGHYRPSADVLKGLADALQVSASSLYAQLGWLDENDPDTTGSVEDAIRRDPKLTVAQQDMLIQVYRTVLG